MSVSQELSQRIARLFQSPYWKARLFSSSLTDYGNYQRNFVEQITQSETYENLPDGIKQEIQRGEKSLAIAQDMNLTPPYTSDDTDRILSRMKTEGILKPDVEEESFDINLS